MVSSNEIYFGPAEAKAWHNGCRGDEARNLFVIPSVKRLIKKNNALTVLDVGCGTGYICEKLSELDVRWTLLDKSAAMLNFARDALVGRNNTSYVSTSLSAAVDRKLVATHDIVLSAYSVLEVDDLQEFANACRMIIRERGLLALYVPDCLEDVSCGSETDFERFRAGVTRLQKVNAFTSTELVFFARRVEQYLAVFTARGFALVGIEEFVSSAGKRHFALIFMRFG